MKKIEKIKTVFQDNDGVEEVYRDIARIVNKMNEIIDRLNKIK